MPPKPASGPAYDGAGPVSGGGGGVRGQALRGGVGRGPGCGLAIRGRDGLLLGPARRGPKAATGEARCPGALWGQQYPRAAPPRPPPALPVPGVTLRVGHDMEMVERLPFGIPQMGRMTAGGPSPGGRRGRRHRRHRRRVRRGPGARRPPGSGAWPASSSSAATSRPGLAVTSRRWRAGRPDAPGRRRGPVG